MLRRFVRWLLTPREPEPERCAYCWAPLWTGRNYHLCPIDIAADKAAREAHP